MQSDANNELEKALHEAHRTQSLLDATIKSTASGVVVCDLDVNFVLVNPAARKILGRISELGPDHWDKTLGLFESVGGRLYSESELPLYRACKGEIVERMELLVRNGICDEPIWLEANATQIFGLKNEPLGAVTVFNDITAEKNAREGLLNLQKQTESELAASNQQLDDVLNTIPEAIWRGVYSEERFQFTYFSAGIEAITGFLPQQLTDGKKKWVDLVHPDDRSRIKRLVVGMSSGDIQDTDIESRLIHADGTTRWIINRIRAVKSGDSQIVQGIISDITHQRETKQVLARAERLASIGTLAAGMAHEINNPLAAIMLTAELAKMRINAKDGIPSAQLEEAFDDIKEQVERCAKIVKGVLRFANNETSERNVCSLHQIVSESIKLIKFEANKRKIDIRAVEVEGPEPLANVNETEIGQVLGNLLGNSIDASPDGAQIEVTVRVSGGKVLCSVTDHGTGMNPEDRRAVFDPFYTSKRKHGGTGLGLSMCHSIISSHDGEIWIEDTELGKGTTFCFSLPVARESGGDVKS